MAVGYPSDKNTIDNHVGALAIRIRDSLREAAAFKAWLDEQNDASLMALGYSQVEADLLQASFTDLYNLNRVATGQMATGANDFFFNSRKLTGVR